MGAGLAASPSTTTRLAADSPRNNSKDLQRSDEKSGRNRRRVQEVEDDPNASPSGFIRQRDADSKKKHSSGAPTLQPLDAGEKLRENTYLVQGIDRTVSGEHLKAMFDHFGVSLAEGTTPKRRQDSRMKNVAREEIEVVFGSSEEAQLAVQYMDGGVINGKVVKLVAL